MCVLVQSYYTCMSYSISSPYKLVHEMLHMYVIQYIIKISSVRYFRAYKPQPI